MSRPDDETNRVLDRLVHAIELGAGSNQFTLYFVECGLQRQQDEYIAELRRRSEKYGVDVVQLNLRDRIVQDVVDVVAAWIDQLPGGKPARFSVAITGLESSILLDEGPEQRAMLQVLNLAREKFPKVLPYTFTIWLSDQMLRTVQTAAPDFWSWRSGEPEVLPVTAGLLVAEAEAATSLGANDSWNTAVARVACIEYVIAADATSELDVLTRVQLQSTLGDAYLFLGRHAKARDAFEKALALAGERALPEWRGRLLNKLGMALDGCGDTERAIAFFQDYLEATESDDEGRVAALINLGLVYLSPNSVDLTRATAVLDEALKICESSAGFRDAAGRQELLSNALGSLGLANFRAGNLDDAIGFFQQSLKLSDGLADQRIHIRDLLNLGVANAKRGRLDVALGLYQDAVVVSDRAGDLSEAMRSRVTLADLLVELGGTSAHGDDRLPDRDIPLDPQHWYEEALGKAREMQDERASLKILLAMARHSEGLGDRNKITARYDEALRQAHDLDNQDGQLICLAALIRTYGRGDPDAVQRLNQQAFAILGPAARSDSVILTAWLSDRCGRLPPRSGGMQSGEDYTLCVCQADLTNRSDLLPVAQSAVLSRLVRAGRVLPLSASISFGVARFADVRPPAPSKPSVLPTPGQQRPGGPVAQTVSSTVRAAPSEASGIPASSISSEPVAMAVEASESVTLDVQVSGINCDISHPKSSIRLFGASLDSLFVRVRPTSPGPVYLELRCEAEGMPFDMRLSATAHDHVAGEATIPGPSIGVVAGHVGASSRSSALHSYIARREQELRTRLMVPILLDWDDPADVEMTFTTHVLSLAGTVDLIPARPFTTRLQSGDDSGLWQQRVQSGTVRIVLVDRATDYAIPDEFARASRVLLPLPGNPSPPLASKHLLWVDDQPGNVAPAIDMVRMAGAEVVTCLATSDALRTLGEESFDAVITDQLREEDGFRNNQAGNQLLEQLRVTGSSTPVILATAFPNEPQPLERGFYGAASTAQGILDLVVGATQPGRISGPVEDRGVQTTGADADILANRLAHTFMTELDSAVAERDLEQAVMDASLFARQQILNEASMIRQGTWRNPEFKAQMERTIPVFRALTRTDLAGFHRLHGELGFALKDQRAPDWTAAEDELTQAIELRDQSGRRAQYELYEFNRAICRIQLASQQTGDLRTEDGARRSAIYEDLQIVAQHPGRLGLLLEQEPIPHWLEANQLGVQFIETVRRLVAAGSAPQEEWDSAATALVVNWLFNASTDFGVPQEDFEQVLGHASALARQDILQRASSLRRATWRDPGTKQAMERTIPVFRALIKTAPVDSHRLHAQLGYALKDQRSPDWKSAEAELSTAIQLRDRSPQAGQHEIYEFNRAVCRIRQAEHERGRLRTDDSAARDAIYQDLLVARRSRLPRLLQEEPVPRWLAANDLTSSASEL